VDHAPAGPLASVALVLSPVDGQFDYQLGGDCERPAGVTILSRDWFGGGPLGGNGCSTCYINAYRPKATRMTSTAPTNGQIGCPRSIEGDVEAAAGDGP
jgi:hypothetical protein